MKSLTKQLISTKGKLSYLEIILPLLWWQVFLVSLVQLVLLVWLGSLILHALLEQLLTFDLLCLVSSSAIKSNSHENIAKLLFLGLGYTTKATWIQPKVFTNPMGNRTLHHDYNLHLTINNKDLLLFQEIVIKKEPNLSKKKQISFKFSFNAICCGTTRTQPNMKFNYPIN